MKQPALKIYAFFIGCFLFLTLLNITELECAEPQQVLRVTNTPDSPYTYIAEPDIAVDSEGHWHMVYFEYTFTDLPSRKIKYLSSKVATPVTVASLDEYYLVDISPSIAVDPQDNLHIVYSQYEYISPYTEVYSIKYININNISGNWSEPQQVLRVTNTPDSPYTYIAEPDIAVDSEGNWHMVYFEYTFTDLPSRKIKYLSSKVATPVTVASLDEAYLADISPSIAVDPQDNLHIVYSQYEYISPYTEVYSIKYININNISGNWSEPQQVLRVTNTLDSPYTYIAEPDIAVDSEGNWHMVYFEYTFTDLPSRKIKYLSSKVATPVTVASLGEYYLVDISPSIAVDLQDNLHIVYSQYEYISPYTEVYSIMYLQLQPTPKIPLGGSKEVEGATKPEFYRIYIPTRWGGTLTVTVNNGCLELYYPDTSTKIAGPDTTIRYDIPFERDNEPVDEHGWYYVKCGGAASYKISNTFVQEGEAAYRPWNFWYWPLQPQANPAQNLYGKGGVLAKYDVVFGTTARAYEEQHYSSGVDWAGHCWGGSVASILVPQPQAIIYDGQSFSQEEVEGLVTKLADTDAKDLEKLVTGIPLKPIEGADETDKHADEFHKGLVDYLRIREERKQKPLQSNLRDPNGEDPKAVWNHAIYKYASIMEESEEGMEDIIKITTTIYANNDLFFPSDNTIDRKETYVYKLKYTREGEVYRKFTEQDWISATGFAPYNLWFIESSWFDGLGELYNPEVKKENVEKLGVDFL